MPTRNDRLLKRRIENVPQVQSNVNALQIKKAEGALMTDVNGREFIDFAGGIGVNNVGHCNPKVTAAIKDQADKLIHTCFHVGMYEIYVDLAAMLN